MEMGDGLRREPGWTNVPLGSSLEEHLRMLQGKYRKRRFLLMIASAAIWAAAALGVSVTLGAFQL